MIYYNCGELETDGNLPTIMADISTVLHVLTLQISQDTGKTYEEALEWLSANIIAPMLEIHESETNGEDGDGNG